MQPRPAAQAGRDWGALRAWAWGAARGLDYLETDSTVDAMKVGIEGVSRFGKAALVTMAFEPRFAMVLVGSFGEGGAKPHRRDFGEAVENLTGVGRLPLDGGQFPEIRRGGSEFWQQERGRHSGGCASIDCAVCAAPGHVTALLIQPKCVAFLRNVAAGSVFRLLGARDLGDTNDYRLAKMPAVNTGLLDGELVWRQHDGGHESRSNLKHFIGWANRFLNYQSPIAAPAK